MASLIPPNTRPPRFHHPHSLNQSFTSNSTKHHLQAPLPALERLWNQSLIYVTGAPGVGKTQLTSELAFQCASQGEEVIYVDSEGSFLNKFQSMSAKNESTQLLNPKVLQHIEIYRITNLEEHLSILHDLPHIVFDRNCTSTHDSKPVRLVIIDSVSFFFRGDTTGKRLKTIYRMRLLFDYIQLFSKVAHCINRTTSNPVTFIFVNQVTTKVSKTNRGVSSIAPSLGQLWVQSFPYRLVIMKDESPRGEGSGRQVLVYSSSDDLLRIRFRITDNGMVQDCVEQAIVSSQSKQ